MVQDDLMDILFRTPSNTYTSSLHLDGGAAGDFVGIDVNGNVAKGYAAADGGFLTNVHR